MLIAVDTNVLLDQAKGKEDVIDSLALIRERIPNARLVVTPTALEELAYMVDHETGEKQPLALCALNNLLAWGYEPINLIPVGRGIVEDLGTRMRFAGIIDERETHDAEVIAEAALIGCTLLLSSDRHILEANESGKLQPFLKDRHVEGDSLVAESPREIVRKFFGR